VPVRIYFDSIEMANLFGLLFGFSSVGFFIFLIVA